MNVIDGQAGLVFYSSLIFYSLTINNILNIVVLIILATVAINIAMGDNGIFNKAKTAKEQYQNAQDYEEEQIAKYSNEIDSYVDERRYGGVDSSGIGFAIKEEFLLDLFSLYKV